MVKTTTITFLLAGFFALSANVHAQQPAKPSEHDHAQHDHSDQKTTKQDAHDHSGHDMSHDEHDHSGHSMSQQSGAAVDHSKMDHSDHAHDHDVDHSTHGVQATEHGDMQHHHHMDHDHMMDHEGTMIMGQNLDQLPSSCRSISEEVEITVRAGRKYSAKFPGTAFAFDQQEWHVKPCAKVTFHFINEDNIRHQFMMHGLPKYLYKYGMFHLEVTGPKTVSGTIIVPGGDDTYLVHCDISHHMEKGMKAQLVVGKGGADIPGIPGLTHHNINDTYEAENLPKLADKADQSKMVRQITQFTTDNLQTYGMMLAGLLLGLFCVPLIRKIPLRRNKENKS